jgi:hypothetical protein
MIDASLLPSISSVLLETNSVPNPDQSVLNLIAGPFVSLTADAFGGVTITNTASAPSFNVITSGENVMATMTVGTGASLTVNGTGIIEATELATNTATPIAINSSAPTHAGQLLISQPGNASAVWADPLVQGLYPDGTLISTPINPVYVGGNQAGTLYGLQLDASKYLYVDVAAGSVGITGTVAVTQSTSPWVVDASGYTVPVSSTQLPAALDSGNLMVAVENIPEVTIEGVGTTTVGSPAETGLNVYVLNQSGTGSNVNVVSPVDGGGNVKVAIENTPTVNVGNFPATQPVSGTVAVSNQPAFAFTPYGSPAVEALDVYVVNPSSGTITGTVSVTNFPSVQHVIVDSATLGTVTVTGSVSVSNFPATVAVTQSTSPWVVSLASTTITGSVAVTGTFWQALQPVQDVAAEASLASIAADLSKLSYTLSGSPPVQALDVYVTNQTTGSVTITNFPSVQHVIVDSATLGTVTIAGSVSVSNFPATQPVSGTVTALQGTSPWIVSNPVLSEMTFNDYGSPPVEALNVYVVNPITGTVSVSNFPTTFAVTQSTSPWVVSGTVIASAGTGNFTVVNGGTFAVQAAQSGTWNIGTVTAVTAITDALPAGTNVIGHVITDSGSTTAVTGTVAVTQSTSPWVVDFSSPQHVIVDSATLGTVTVTGTVAATQSGAWNVNQTLSTPGYEAITDGTNGPVAVKAASTPAVASDKALVVAVSPNNTVAVTESGTWTVQAVQSGSWNIGSVTSISDTVTVTGTVSLSGTSAINLAQVLGSSVSLSNYVPVGLSDGTNLIGTSSHPAYVQFASAQAVTLTSTTITGTVAVTESGTWTVQPGNTPNTTPWLFTVNQGGNSAIVTAAGALKVDGSAVTQPVSGTVTVNGLPQLSSSLYGSPPQESLNVYVVNPVSLSSGSSTIGRVEILGNAGAVLDAPTGGAIPPNAVQVAGSDGYFSRPLATDPYGRFNIISTGILNDNIVGMRQNQVEVNFSQASFDNGNAINTTVTTGSAAQANGQGVYSTGTDPAGRATGVSAQNLLYRPGTEVYAEFTATFTAGVASSYQRIGAYTSGGSDGGDGFYVGYEGATFNASVRQAGIDTHYPKASWIDKLDGSVGSRFTRLGVPEAVNFTKLNLYRIRWSWFGAAPQQWEIFSPDGYWVIWFRIAYPNTEAVPSIFNSNVGMQVDVANTGNTSNLTINTACWAAGVTSPEIRVDDTITDSTLATVGRSVLVGKNPSGSYGNVGLSAQDALTVAGSGTSMVNAVVWTSATAQNTVLNILTDNYNENTVTVSVTDTGSFSSGVLTFEGSIDNANFVGIIGVNVGTGQTMSNATYTLQTGTSVFTFNATGFNYFRVRLSTAITGTGSPPGSPTTTISWLTQGLASPNVQTTITTGTVNVSSNQGTPNSLSNAWPMEITDGTHGPATVKLGSVAAVPGDEALVVAISPNNTVAVTQSTSPWVSNIEASGTALTATGSSLNVNVTSGTISGTFTQVTAAPTGTPVPTDADYVGVDIGGNLYGLTGFGFGSPPHVVAAAVALVDGGGNQITSSNPLYVAGTVTVQQGTAANLNATVVGTGTFAVQAAQSGTWNIGSVTSISDTVTVTGTVALSGTSAFNLTQVLGSAVSLTNYVPVGLSDGTNLLGTSSHPVYTQFASAQAVTLTSTTITGTVAVTQSTSPWIVAGGGTAGSPGTAVLTVQGISGGQTIPVTATIAASQTIAVTNTGTFAVQAACTQSTSPWVVSGTVAVSNFPATQPVSGTVSVSNQPAFAFTGYGSPPVNALDVYVVNPSSGSVTVSGNVTVVQSSGSALHVDVDNFPATVAVTQSTSPWVVSLASTTITGTVAVTQSTSPWAVSGTVSVSNFPAVQPVSGTVAVSNQPGFAFTSSGSPPVNALDVYLVNPQTSVSVTNFPATQTVTGTVNVGNFPATTAVTQNTSPWIVKDTTLESLVSTIGSPPVTGLNANIVNDVTVSQSAEVVPAYGQSALITSATAGTPSPVPGFGTLVYQVTNPGYNGLLIRAFGSTVNSSSYVMIPLASVDGVNWDEINVIYDNFTQSSNSSMTFTGLGFPPGEGAQSYRIGTAGWKYIAFVQIGNLVSPDTVTLQSQFYLEQPPLPLVTQDISVGTQLVPPPSLLPVTLVGGVSGTYRSYTSRYLQLDTNSNLLVVNGASPASEYSQAPISSTSNPAVLVAGVGGQTVKVYRLHFVNSGASTTNVTIQDSTPTSFSGAESLYPGGSYNADGNGDPLFTTATGKGFQLGNSAGQQLSGTIWYIQS